MQMKSEKPVSWYSRDRPFNMNNFEGDTGDAQGRFLVENARLSLGFQIIYANQKINQDEV